MNQKATVSIIVVIALIIILGFSPLYIGLFELGHSTTGQASTNGSSSNSSSNSTSATTNGSTPSGFCTIACTTGFTNTTSSAKLGGLRTYTETYSNTTQVTTVTALIGCTQTTVTHSTNTTSTQT